MPYLCSERHLLLSVTFFLCLFLSLTSTGLRAETVSGIPPAELRQTLSACQAYRRRALPDSALLLVDRLLERLDNTGTSEPGARLWLRVERSRALADKGRFLLALRELSEVIPQVEEERNRELYLAANLAMAGLRITVDDGTAARKGLRNSRRARAVGEFPEFMAEEMLVRSRWQDRFGYRDSVKYYLESFFALPDSAPFARAEALRRYANLSHVDIQYDATAREKMLEEAIEIYRRIDNLPLVAAGMMDLGSLYVTIGDYRSAISRTTSAIDHCRLAADRGQDAAYVQARSEQIKGKAFGMLGQMDSFYFHMRAGLNQEMLYWQRNANYKTAEAVELHRNEQREKLVAEQDRQLRLSRTRNLGLIGFAVLIVVVSFGTIVLYGRLRKAKQLTDEQADALEVSNTELAAAKEDLEESLHLQVMLKAELQHRVKNNMQLIMSIFNRGQKDVENAEVRAMMNTRKEQIKSIALLHQKIDLQTSDHEIEPGEYLTELVTNMERSYAGLFSNVRLHLDLNVNTMHIDSAVPVGLILNELVTNAYKYAFPKGKAGTIRITFSKLKDRFYLRVADDGKGLPDDLDFRRHQSMGTRLIRGLVRQLDGSVEWIDAKPGTLVQVEFSARVKEAV